MRYRRHRSHFTPGYLGVVFAEATAAALTVMGGLAAAIANTVLLALVFIAALATAFGLGLISVVIAMGGVRVEPLVTRWWPFPFPPQPAGPLHHQRHP